MTEKKIFRVNPAVLILLLICVMGGVVLMFYGSIASLGREEEPGDVVMRIIGAVIFVVVGGIAVLLEHKSKKRHIEFLSKRHLRTSDALDSVMKLGMKVKEDSGKLFYLIAEIEDALVKLAPSLEDIKNTGDVLQEESDAQTKAAYNIKKTVAKAGSKTHAMTEMARESLKIIAGGNDSVRALKNTSATMTDTNVAMRRTLSDFVDKIGRLKEKTKKINEISSQAGLLSLNVTVECSRAGTAGRGFVVAGEELRGLSDKTRTLTDEIDVIATELQYGAETADKYIGAMSDHIGQENAMIEYSKNSYDQLSERFNDLYESFSMIRRELAGIEKSGDELVQSINAIASVGTTCIKEGKDIYEIGEQNLRRTEKTAQLAKELADAVEEIERYI